MPPETMRPQFNAGKYSRAQILGWLGRQRDLPLVPKLQLGNQRSTSARLYLFPGFLDCDPCCRGARSGPDRAPPQLSLLRESFGDRDRHRDRGADHGVVAHADQPHHLDVGRHR